MNGYGNSVFLRTAFEVSSGGTPPANTVVPVISGTQVVGSTLTSTTGTWTGTPVPTFTYQWFRGATLIGGATSSTYVLVQADAGNTSNITCQVTGTNAFGNATATSNTLAQIFDFDANAFITSAVITDNTQKAATNSLTIDLKGYSIWTKMKAIYPIVGGTATTHKFNLKNPLDTNAAFRMVFSGGWTHNSNGITGNGVNTEALTKLIPLTSLSTTSGSLGFYLRNLQSANVYDFSPGVSNFFGIALYLDTRYYMYGGLTSISGLPSPAFYAISRVGGTHKGYRNGFVDMTSTSTATLNANELRFNTNLRNYAFGYISDGLTDAESANLYTAVQAYQTSLSRNV